MEKYIATLSTNDLLTKVYYTFQGKKHFYFVMEYMNNGDLG